MNEESSQSLESSSGSEESQKKVAQLQDQLASMNQFLENQNEAVWRTNLLNSIKTQTLILDHLGEILETQLTSIKKGLDNIGKVYAAAHNIAVKEKGQ